MYMYVCVLYKICKSLLYWDIPAWPMELYHTMISALTSSMQHSQANGAVPSIEAELLGSGAGSGLGTGLLLGLSSDEAIIKQVSSNSIAIYII